MYSSLDDRWVFVSGTMLWSAATNLFLQAVKFLNNINLNNIEFRIINSLWLLFVALCPPFRLLLIIVKSHNLVVHTFRPALHFSSIQAWFRAALKCRFRNYCFVEVNRRKCSKTCLKIRPTIQLAQLRSFIESNSDTESIILDIQQYCTHNKVTHDILLSLLWQSLHWQKILSAVRAGAQTCRGQTSPERGREGALATLMRPQRKRPQCKDQRAAGSIAESAVDDCEFLPKLIKIILSLYLPCGSTRRNS